MKKEEIMKEVFGLIEDVLDTLIEVGNGTTDELLHEAANKLFMVRDLLEATMTDNRYLPICKSCAWYDPARPQCFDGHLQYSGKTECDGFERPLSMEGKT